MTADDIGRRLREVRLERGLSLRSLAQTLGGSASLIVHSAAVQPVRDRGLQRGRRQLHVREGAHLRSGVELLRGVPRMHRVARFAQAARHRETHGPGAEDGSLHLTGVWLNPDATTLHIQGTLGGRTVSLSVPAT